MYCIVLYFCLTLHSETVYTTIKEAEKQMEKTVKQNGHYR